MNQSILKAIAQKHLVSFVYDNIERIAEPHTYGADSDLKDVLSVWQISGKIGDKPGWRLLLLSKVTKLQVLPKQFANARSGYKRNDSRMTTIYAQI